MPAAVVDIGGAGDGAGEALLRGLQLGRGAAVCVDGEPAGLGSGRRSMEGCGSGRCSVAACVNWNPAAHVHGRREVAGFSLRARARGHKGRMVGLRTRHGVRGCAAAI